MAQSRSVAIAVALIGAAGTLGGALIAARPWAEGDSADTTTPARTDTLPPISFPDTTAAQVFLSRDSGPGGTSVNVSGEGFGPDERVVLRFHTEQIGATAASGEGTFSNVTVMIPTSFSIFAPQQFDVVATGQESHKGAQAPFTITG